MRSERPANPNLIAPVKTRLNQRAPLPNQKIIMILEGAFVQGDIFIGKALFTLKNGDVYDFSNIEYSNLIFYRHLVSFDMRNAIPCSILTDDGTSEQIVLHFVDHSGLCGPNSIGEALGLSRDSQDPNSAGKIILQKLVAVGYYRKQNIPDPNLDQDHLDSIYWLNSESSKFSYFSVVYWLTIFHNEQ